MDYLEKKPKKITPGGRRNLGSYNALFRGGTLLGGGLIKNEDKIYLTLSEEAYKAKDKRAPQVDEYLYDPALSTDRTAVYFNPSTTSPQGNRLIIAHRGTQANLSDVKQDVQLAVQLRPSGRLDRAMLTVQEALAKYPGYTLSQTGHSLGGYVASKLARELPLENSKVVAFNVGSSPADLVEGVKNKAKCLFGKHSEYCKKLKNQRFYTTGLDPISLGAILHAGESIVVRPEMANVHSLANFK